MGVGLQRGQRGAAQLRSALLGVLLRSGRVGLAHNGELLGGEMAGRGGGEQLQQRQAAMRGDGEAR